jgi:hypothetical protein
MVIFSMTLRLLFGSLPASGDLLGSYHRYPIIWSLFYQLCMFTALLNSALTLHAKMCDFRAFLSIFAPPSLLPSHITYSYFISYITTTVWYHLGAILACIVVICISLRGIYPSTIQFSLSNSCCFQLSNFGQSERG